MNLDRDTLEKLNSMTKYPSIPTYHALGDKGRLTETIAVPFAPDERVIGTEKVDGTNSRVTVLPSGDVLIGSREEWLHCMGDKVHNPAMGIVDTVWPLAEQLEIDGGRKHALTFYVESYGGKIGAGAKQYGTTNTSFRVFDISEIDIEDMREMLRWDRARIAAWRDAGGQRFFSHDALVGSGLPTVPVLFDTKAGLMQGLAVGTMSDARAMLKHWPETRCGLTANGKSEGIVVRTPDRSKIAKLRTEDYERALRK